MQILIIFGPLHRVKNITLSAMNFIWIGLFLLVILFTVYWVRKSVSSEVKEALYSEINKDPVAEGLSKGSKSLYETKLMQLRMRLESLQHKLDQLTLAKGGPLRSSYGTLSLMDQGESYSARLDRAHSDSIVLDRRLDIAQKEQSEKLNATNAMPSAPPLPLPLRPSSGLGYRIDPFTYQIAWHEGVDFQAAYGTPILATGAGVVIRAAWHHEYGYVVDIQHQNFIVTRYAHAQRLLVKEGDLVSQSQVIATVGSTGRSTGPHLHYEVLKHGKRLVKGG